LNDTPVLENLDPSYNYLEWYSNLRVIYLRHDGTTILGATSFLSTAVIQQGKVTGNVLEFLYSVVLMVLLYLDGDASV